MRLFSLPSGSVDRKTRAWLFTQPFDFAFGPPINFPHVLELFSIPSGTVNRKTRAWLMTQPFDLAFTTIGFPVADFVGSPLSGNTPLDVQFTDLSTGSPISWLWDFGDGNTSTEQNPLHDYLIGGTYTVELTATNANGSDSDTKTDYIIVSAVTPLPTLTPTIYGTLDFTYTRYGTLGFGDGELENG